MAIWLAFELQEELGRAGRSVAEEVFTNRGDEFEERLQRIYLRRVTQYLTDVAAEYKALGGHRHPGEFPVITMMLPLGMVTVQFDAELDSQLLFVYVVHGWPGIRELERALNDRRNYPGIGIREPWESAQAFFRVTRHLLSLRIRAALIRVESVLRRMIFERLDTSRASLDGAIATLKISGDSSGGPLKAGNETKLADAYEKITNVFETRRVLARLRLDLQVFEEHIGERRRALQQRTEGLSGGVILPSEQEDLPESKEIKSLEARRDEVAAEAEDTDQALKELSAALDTLLPSLLLCVPQLKDKFTRADFDKAVVETIISMRKIIDDLAPGTASGGGSVGGFVPFDPASLNRLDPAALRPLDVAAIVAEKALEGIGDDLSLTALVDDQTLREALSSGVFPVGGFEYIVATHYALSLIGATEAVRKKEEKWKSVADACTKLASAASLASLVAAATMTPQGLAAAGTLRVAALAFSIPPMIFAAYSVVHQLSKLDEAIRLRVASADFSDIGSVVELGNLVELREQQVEELTSTLLQLLAEQLVSNVAVLKSFLLMRGYFYDIEALLPLSEGTPPPAANPLGATDG